MGFGWTLRNALRATAAQTPEIPCKQRAFVNAFHLHEVYCAVSGIQLRLHHTFFVVKRFIFSRLRAIERRVHGPFCRIGVGAPLAVCCPGALFLLSSLLCPSEVLVRVLGTQYLAR
jgi:hypothetical protein